MTKPGRDPPSQALWREALERFEHLYALDTRAVASALSDVERERPDLHPVLATLLRAHQEVGQGGFMDAPDLPAFAERTAPLEPGATLGSYRLERPVGAGGMGEVWLARRADGLFEAPVALKLLHAHLLVSTLRARFVREGRILGQLSHPNIARLLDAGSLPGNRLYLAIEYVEGERIDRWCDVARLSIEARLRLFLQVCEAVAHAHTRLIVHRDLKPSNVLVTAAGEVKLLDFGIAKLIERDETASAPTELTRVGGRVLTPEYAAPEQILGAPITTTTDVYSLGMILYGLLCGRRPYGDAGATASQIERDAVEREPDPPSRFRTERGETTLDDAASLRSASATQLRSTLRGDLDTIVGRALRKAPGERYPSVVAFADDVRRFLENRPVLARPDSLTYRARKYVRRNRAGVAIAASLAVLVLGAMAAVIVNARTTARHASEVVAREARLREVVDFQGAMLDRVNLPAFGKDFHGRVGGALERRVRQGQTPGLPDRDTLMAIQQQLPSYVSLTDVARESLVAGVLAPAQAEMAERFAGRPDVLAALYDSLAQSYASLTRWPAVDSLSRKAAALHESQGADSANAALASRTRRARAMLELGQLKEGLVEAEAIVAERSRLLGPDDPDVWTSQSVVANAFVELGRLDDARTLQEALLAKMRARFGEAHETTLAMLGDLGTTLQVQSKDDESVVLLEQAVAGYTRLRGPLHPKTVALRIAHANAMASSLRTSKASALLQPLITELREVFGDDDPRTLAAYSALATVHYHLNETQEVLRLDEKVAESRLRLQGPDDLELLTQRHNIAISHFALRHPSVALEILQDVHARRARLLGAAHPDTLITLVAVATALRPPGPSQDLPRARRLGEEAVASLRTALGDEHHWTVVAHDELATICLRMNEMACACEHGQIAYDFFRTKREYPPSAEARLNRMAACRRALGDVAAAEALEQRKTGVTPLDPQ